MNSVRLVEHKKLSRFLSEQPSGVLAVPVNDKGVLHAAAILYWHDPIRLRFYFVTAKDSEKLTLLETKAYIPAALVVGTEKGTYFTVQMRGKLQLIDPKENSNIVDSYYAKRQNRNDNVEELTN